MIRNLFVFGLLTGICGCLTGCFKGKPQAYQQVAYPVKPKDTADIVHVFIEWNEDEPDTYSVGINEIVLLRKAVAASTNPNTYTDTIICRFQRDHALQGHSLNYVPDQPMFTAQNCSFSRLNAAPVLNFQVPAALQDKDCFQYRNDQTGELLHSIALRENAVIAVSFWKTELYKSMDDEERLEKIVGELNEMMGRKHYGLKVTAGYYLVAEQ